MLHNDLSLARELVYDKCGYEYNFISEELESAEYSACIFKLNHFLIKYRAAKITPTKVGQFVTVWKRSEEGPIEPLNALDPVDFVIISTRKDHNFGLFIFPKSALCKFGIMTVNKKEGKRGFRLYPPWDKTMSKQAQATQAWQLNFFLEIPKNKAVDTIRMQQLLEISL